MFLLISLGLLCCAFSVQAATFTFEDKIEMWPSIIGPVDAKLITHGNTVSYTHDLNQEVNFLAGESVTNATLSLDFTNDTTDDHFWILWDFRETARVAFDGNGWISLGEVDDGVYPVILDIAWLNDNGLLDVKVKVANDLGTASAWLDASTLSGTAITGVPGTNTSPVPEPGTMLLLGSGLLAVAFAARKSRK